MDIIVKATDANRPICGWCGHDIPDGDARLDPRGADEDGKQRAVHVECDPKFRTALAEQERQSTLREVAEANKRIDALKAAVVAVWTTYLNWGPVDDGSQQGRAFEAALDEMRDAAIEAGVKFHRRRKRKGA